MSNVNYIAHLNGWFEKSYEDRRLSAVHMSLYMALFQFWNLNRFQNPFTIIREDIMKASKIGSKTTYTKCLKDLHTWQYIKYDPSFNPHRGSQVYLYTFGKGTVQVVGKVNGPIYKQYKHNKQVNKNVSQNKNYNEPL
ncbi:MAG: hypothetical protein R8G66_10220 [Cytophagales bacterium]|nr:hypothetical protein [Cytophagales bacterium]